MKNTLTKSKPQQNTMFCTTIILSIDCHYVDDMAKSLMELVFCLQVMFAIFRRTELNI